MMVRSYSDSQTITQAFKKLQENHAQEKARIATKEILSAIEEEKEIVKQASEHTSETIFEDLGKLQGSFNQSIDILMKEMNGEAEKLESLSKAFAIKKDHLKILSDVQTAAEALNILQQEHRNKIELLEKEYQQKFDDIEKEITQQRELWEQEKKEHAEAQEKQKAALERTRTVGEEDYNYTLEQERAQDEDDYKKRKRILEYELSEENRVKELDWQEREKKFEDNKEQVDDYRAQVEAMKSKTEEAVKKAREEAIRETAKEEEHKAQLLEKEAESETKTFELKIMSLDKVVEEQSQKINRLTEKLQAAYEQVQQLAMTAVTSTGSSNGGRG
jgi:hypothetical protein